MGAYAVRSGDWKLVYSKLGRGLFNLKNDTFESNDLSSQNPEIVSRLQKLYTEWDRHNIPSKWNPELIKKYWTRRQSTNPLENKTYQYNSTFGDEE